MAIKIIMSPLLKNLLVRLLLLTQCIFFKIDPEQKSILVKKGDFRNHESPNLDIDQLVTNYVPTEQQIEQMENLTHQIIDQGYEISK
jgi:hypothetical protein